jgi:hypothetical protein
VQCTPDFRITPLITNPGDDLERELFIVRKLVEKEKAGRLAADKAFDFYTCSLSTRTIVYKVCTREWGSMMVAASKGWTLWVHVPAPEGSWQSLSRRQHGEGSRVHWDNMRNQIDMATQVWGLWGL